MLAGFTFEESAKWRLTAGSFSSLSLLLSSMITLWQLMSMDSYMNVIRSLGEPPRTAIGARDPSSVTAFVVSSGARPQRQRHAQGSACTRSR